MKLSIIVPVYNAAPWLARCLDSLLDQGLDGTEHEIILVDDGSTDSSPTILARYAAEHPQIRVISQENCGQGQARNHAMDLARGEWIAFVDADDYLAAQALSHLLPFCDESTDGVRFYSQLLTPGLAVEEANLDRNEIAFKGNGHDFISKFGLDTFCWSWLYKKHFLDEHGIRFPLGVGEDQLFLYRFLISAPAVVTIPVRIYQYIVHESSLTTRKTKESFSIWSKDLIAVFSTIKKESDSFQLTNPHLYESITDSLSRRIPMLFSRIIKADLTIREFRQLVAKLKEGRLLPAHCKTARIRLRLSLSAINFLASFPLLYAPGKSLFRCIFSVVYPRLNRNKSR